MQTTSRIVPKASPATRRFGYGVAVLVNLVLLVVVLEIRDWGWAPFLTAEFAEVVPWISFSLVASIIANLVYQFDDGAPVRSMGDITTNLVSVFATYRVLQVFPFDFAGYSFDWEPVVRVLLVLALVGAGIGMLVAVGRLIGAAVSDR